MLNSNKDRLWNIFVGSFTSDTIKAMATIDPYPTIAVGTAARNPVLPAVPCSKNGVSICVLHSPENNALPA